MAKILRAANRDFQENPNKIEPFHLLSDVSRAQVGVNPVNLNFDLRQLNPGQFSAPYHFHRNAEELFLVISGCMSLRTPEGITRVNTGDLLFFEMGEAGAHQFYNDGSEPCTYLDVRTFLGSDICEYPDSGKILLAPSMEVFRKESKVGYFEGEEKVVEKWNRSAKNGE